MQHCNVPGGLQLSWYYQTIQFRNWTHVLPVVQVA
jgi:hypothetical protein